MKLRLVVLDPQPRECAASRFDWPTGDPTAQLRGVTEAELRRATGAIRAGEISEGDALALGYVADEDFTALDRFEWDMDARYGVEAWRGLWVRLEGET